jgi:GAF domain-containing protein
MTKRSAEGYLETLQKTAHALSSVLQEAEVIQILLQEVVSAISVQKALVLLLSGEGDQLLLSGAKGLNDAYLKKMALQVADSKINQRVLAGELVAVSDARGESDFSQGIESEEGLEGIVAVPMWVRERVIGILHVYLDAPIVLKPEELVLLRAMTDLGALALEKVRLRQSLYGIAEAVSSSLDLEPMLQRVLEATVKEMWLKAGSIRLLEPKRKILRLISSYGLSEAYRLKGDVHLEKSEIDRRVLQGEAVVIHSIQDEPGFEYPKEAKAEGILSVLAVPLILRTNILGVMHVFSSKPREFGPVAVTFLKSVADLVSLAVENAKLYAQLKARYKDLKVDLAEWYRFLTLG